MRKSNLLFFFLLGCIVVACRQEKPSSSQKEEYAPIHISPEGDDPYAAASLAAGPPLLLVLGSTFSVAQGLQPGQGYAALLQEYLPAGGDGLTVLNASVAGETAAGAFERLRYLLAHPLRQVVLELGQADEARRIPPEAFARDVRKLLRSIRTQHPEVPILILSSTPAPAYNEVLSAAAAETDGVVLSSLLLETGAPIRSGDAALHRRLAEGLLPLVRKD
ncbi:MAG: hypothetical protein KDD19_04750 [Phaeodactylibacter sp.]|nr:hypothetical protein [Phaeodactylibacter sp.]MCB9048486.1 hypothetical protein [Lewinellaceae bacterium]